MKMTTIWKKRGDLRPWQMLAVLAIVAGCSNTPENPGDACDAAANNCPDGLVCAADLAGDNVCQVPLGGECDATVQEAFCEVGTECFETEPEPGVVEGVCAYPVGAACDPTVQGVQCAPELTCAEIVTGDEPNLCFERVFIAGTVTDSQTAAGIEGAQVIAFDDQGTAVTDVAVADVDGVYQVEVPDVQRTADGVPVPTSYTLRSSAADYQTFPGGVRTALPLSTSDASLRAGAYYIETPPTRIALIQLPEEERGRATISGTVLADEKSAGVLVVAENGGIGYSALSDITGQYTIFNVPDGQYSVRGYAAELQLEPADASVAGAPLEGVDLNVSTAPLSTLSGNINIVNAPAEAATSVVLVVASTFDDTFVRGEVPRGLRTPLVGEPDVTGAWQIPNVPDGSYVVLAAFENDLLVRDPDPNIAGTQIVTVDLPDPTDGNDVILETAFKVTEALQVNGPGVDVPEAVGPNPTLSWVDDSSEDFYTLVVYDSFGNLIWEVPDVPAVSGAPDVTVEYAGPALEPGIYYQFRATSWRSPGGVPGPISITEDLRGVFYVE